MHQVAKGESGTCAISKPYSFQEKKTVYFGLLIQTIHVSRGVVSPQLGSKASDEAKLQSFRWGARGGKELPRQLLQPNDYPCWWEKNRHYCTLSTPLNLHLTPLKPVTAGAYGTSPFHSRHRKLWYPGAMGSTELPAPYVPYTNSNLCPPQAGSPRHHSNTLKHCGWICGSGLVLGSGLPCFHLGPRQVLGLPGWQWLHLRYRCSGPHLSAFYPQRFGRGEQARAAASA